MNRREFISRIQVNEQTIERGLVCVLFLLCLGTAVKMIGVVFQKHAITTTVRKSTEFLETQSGKGGEYLQAYAKEMEKLKEKGAFCPEKKETPPQVTGILGDSVFMAGKWCKTDEEHAGAKVLKIEPTQVTVLWKGKEMKLAPLLASNPDDSAVRPNAKDTKAESAAARRMPFLSR